MRPEVRVHALLRRIEREEAALTLRAARGERDAFDALFDRYCARMAHAFRGLPDVEAKARIWETLEQLFAGLDAERTPSLAIRAFRVAKASSKGRAARSARTPGRRRIASRNDH